MTLPSYVGRYEVRSEIARGGFAVVVQAWDEELESSVALKILHRDLARDEDVQLRFLEEARLLRRIRAPNVVTVHDVGRLNDGCPYFVMDFADRGTLEPRLERHSDSQVPDPQSIMALADAMADGLSALHEAGVVHRDIKPANILLQRAHRAPLHPDPSSSAHEVSRPVLVGVDERILLGDLGIAKDLIKHGRFPTLIGGTPLYQAPEQGDPSAEITPAADLYSATALLWHALTGDRPPLPTEMKARLPGLPVAWREVLEEGMALDPEARFSSVESWRSAIHDALARESAEGQADVPTAARRVAALCPYKGLAAYQPEDAHFFYGREALTDELVRRVQLNRVLVVGGPSGSGKSSLVRAGLIPALAGGALPGSETWRVALFTPGRDPMAELHFQLTKDSASNRTSLSFDELVAHPTMARHLGVADSTEQPLVLCIDQFEELFTLAAEAQRDGFVVALSAMVDPADSRVRIVLAIRADFYTACAQFPWLADRISDNQMLVGPMTGPELRRAISEPARPAGLYLERGLVDAIIDEAGSEAGSLPLVAHALVETWARREGNTLTLEGFRAAGGVAGAISQTADATYDQHSNDAERSATKRLFLRLVTPGEDTPDTRRQLPRSEIENDVEPQMMRRVVERLTEARLLTVDDTSIQIAHEALLRTWPRLRIWIEESRDDLRMRQRISRATAEWEAGDRDSDLVYRGTPLLSALEWAGRHPDQLGTLERAFLDASKETRMRAEAVAAERERRTRRVRRVAGALLSFFALGATVASVVAYVEFREAQHNEKVAERATTEARERFAGALGAAAHGRVVADPLLALFLGAEAVARAEMEPPSYDARAAMIGARRVLAQGGPFLLGSPIAAGDALAIALSPDGALLAAGQRNGDIEVIDTATRQRVGPSLAGHKGGVRDLEFGPRGRRLASVGVDGTVRLWTRDGGTGWFGSKVGETDDVVMGVSVAPNGSTVATGNGNGTVQVWDVKEGKPVGEPLIDTALGFNVVEFTPDGRGLVASKHDGTIFGWALPSRTQQFQPVRGAHTSHLLRLAFSPNGDRFATASTDGTSMMVEYPSGRILGPVFGADEQIGSVIFTPDGRVLIGGRADGALRLWDVEKHAPLRTTPSGHGQAIVDVELSEDGRLLATLGRDQVIRLWALGGAYSPTDDYQVGGRAAKGVAFSVDGRYLAAGDDSGALQIWELGIPKDPIILEGHGHQVWALAFSRGGGLMASGDRSGQVRLWTLPDGALRQTLDAQDGAVWSLAFTPDGKSLITASDGRLRLWDIETGSERHDFSHEGGRLTRAVISPDGALVAASFTDGKVRIWNVDDAAMVKEIAADDNIVWSVAFSPDGRYVATASSDEVVALWDVASGDQRGVLTGQTGGATDVAYLPDGVTVIAADRTGKLHWWDATTGRRLSAAWQGHSGASWRIAIHPDGERFATAGDDGRVRVWDELSMDRACRMSRSAFDAVRHNQYLGEGERSVACRAGS